MNPGLVYGVSPEALLILEVFVPPGKNGWLYCLPILKKNLIFWENHVIVRGSV